MGGPAISQSTPPGKEEEGQHKSPQEERVFSLMEPRNKDMIYSISIKGRTCNALIDSRASASFINSQIVEKLRLPAKNKTSPNRVRIADGKDIWSSQLARLECRLGDFEFTDSFHVIPNLPYDIIIGRTWSFPVWTAADCGFLRAGEVPGLIVALAR